MNTEVEIFPISKDEDLDYLMNCLRNGSEFSKAFEFEDDELYNRFFDSIGIDVNTFREKKFYHSWQSTTSIIPAWAWVNAVNY